MGNCQVQSWVWMASAAGERNQLPASASWIGPSNYTGQLAAPFLGWEQGSASVCRVPRWIQHPAHLFSSKRSNLSISFWLKEKGTSGRVRGPLRGHRYSQSPALISAQLDSRASDISSKWGMIVVCCCHLSSSFLLINAIASGMSLSKDDLGEWKERNGVLSPNFSVL